MSHNCMTQKDMELLTERVVSDGRVKIMYVTFLPDTLRVFHTNMKMSTHIMMP